MLLVKWLTELFNPTRVDVRRVWRREVKYQVLRVTYDAWGSPFVMFDGASVVLLNKDGTGVDLVYETHWKHHSGPPVDFSRPREPRAW